MTVFWTPATRCRADNEPDWDANCECVDGPLVVPPMLCPVCADRAEWCGYGDGLPDDNPNCSAGKISVAPGSIINVAAKCDRCKGSGVVADWEGSAIDCTCGTGWLVADDYRVVTEALPVVDQPSHAKGQPFVSMLPTDPHGRRWAMFAPNGSIAPSDGGSVQPVHFDANPGDTVLTWKPYTPWQEAPMGYDPAMLTFDGPNDSVIQLPASGSPIPDDWQQVTE